MSKGKQPQMSRGQRFELLEKKVKQLEMSAQVAQMLIQQIGGSLRPMQSDLAQTIGGQRELQYRVLAVQELLDMNKEAIKSKAEELQIKDFNETSDKEDAELEYVVTDVVAEDSAVIITSTTPEEAEDKGVMRSKLIVAEIGLQALKDELIGKKVGDVVETPIQNTKHRIEILGIRTVPPPKAPELELVPEPEAAPCECPEGCECTDECAAPSEEPVPEDK